MTTPARIAVVSDHFSGPLERETTKFIRSVVDELEKRGEVLFFGRDVGRYPSRGSHSNGAAAPPRPVRRRLHESDPDVVIYCPGPRKTLSVFRTAFSLRRAAPRARHAMIALVPLRKPGRLKPILRYLHPGPILVPSYRSLLLLARLSLRGDVVPLGVDRRLYRTRDSGGKNELRRRAGIDTNAFVFLLSNQSCRLDNLDAVARLCRIAGAVVAVGSKGDGHPTDAMLASRGIRVLPPPDDPAELFGLADCFVFPQRDSCDAVEIPMCVLEALSSGVPVVSTPFGGLRDFLAEGEDLTYWNSADELARAARNLCTGEPAQVRNMDQFGWDRIVDRIMDYMNR